MGRIKRGGAGDEHPTLPFTYEPVPEVEITEPERKLAVSEADEQYKRLEELNGEYDSKPLGKFLELFAKIFVMSNSLAKTKRLIFMTKYATQITDTMVRDKDHKLRDDNIANILKDYWEKRMVDGVFI